MNSSGAASKEAWIIGFGRFGRQAAKLLGSRRGMKLVAIDPDPSHLLEAPHLGAKPVQADGVSYLLENLNSDGKPPAWIIPAAPVHVVFEWLLMSLSQKHTARRIDLPLVVDNVLPNAMRGKNGDVYVSHASWRCPGDCSEPADMCPVSGLSRPEEMYQLLGAFRIDGFAPLVIRSRQLAPGVGGFQPSTLLSLLDRALCEPSPLLVATACRCHGVLSGLSVESRN